MSTHCSICHSESRVLADKALANGASARGTAIRLGLSIHGLQRHQRDHHDPLAGSQPVSNRPSSSGIAELVLLLEREVASSTGRARLDASREYRLALAAQGKTGSQDAGPDAWPALRRILVDATAGYPDVRAAIVAAIKAYEALR